MYSIGTSNRPAADFFDALERRSIRHIVDLRSKPWSRFRHFNRPAMEAESLRRQIRYEWRGDVLGGLSNQDPDDSAASEAVRQLAIDCSQPVAIFCAEGHPEQCHRTWFVGVLLLVRHGVVTRGILRDDREEDITRTLLRVDPKMIPAAIRDEALRMAMEAEAAK